MEEENYIKPKYELPNNSLKKNVFVLVGLIIAGMIFTPAALILNSMNNLLDLIICIFLLIVYIIVIIVLFIKLLIKAVKNSKLLYNGELYKKIPCDCERVKTKNGKDYYRLTAIQGFPEGTITFESDLVDEELHTADLLVDPNNRKNYILTKEIKEVKDMVYNSDYKSYQNHSELIDIDIKEEVKIYKKGTFKVNLKGDMLGSILTCLFVIPFVIAGTSVLLEGISIFKDKSLSLENSVPLMFMGLIFLLVSAIVLAKSFKKIIKYNYLKANGTLYKNIPCRFKATNTSVNDVRVYKIQIDYHAKDGSKIKIDDKLRTNYPKNEVDILIDLDNPKFYIVNNYIQIEKEANK